MFAGKTTVVLRRHRPWLELAGDGGCGASPPFAAPNRDPVLREALELEFFPIHLIKAPWRFLGSSMPLQKTIDAFIYSKSM
ncbi:hypothetical protein VPH35_127906 [Triticum aestivum]